MKTINDLIPAYIELESSIRMLMSTLFSDTCGLCTACCCRADICEEAVESAFLSKLLQKQGLDAENMDDRFGWLDLAGCTLEYGKPPVCYAYYCDQLMARLPDDDTRYVTSVLGKLILHVGQNALGEWHLAEIRNPEDLDSVDFARVTGQLEEAKAAFEVVEHYVQAGRLTAADRKTLACITTDEP